MSNHVLDRPQNSNSQDSHLSKDLCSIPVLGEVHVVGLSAAVVAGDAPAGQRHEVVLELDVKLALPGQTTHTDRVC